MLEIADPIWENIIQGSNTNNYDKLSKDFSSKMLKEVSKEEFERQIAEGFEETGNIKKEKEIDITIVYHDLDDHDWQFLANIEINKENASLVSLKSIVDLDKTVLEVAKIPPGYKALRETKNDPWLITKTA